MRGGKGYEWKTLSNITLERKRNLQKRVDNERSKGMGCESEVGERLRRRWDHWPLRTQYPGSSHTPDPRIRYQQVSGSLPRASSREWWE